MHEVELRIRFEVGADYAGFAKKTIPIPFPPTTGLKLSFVDWREADEIESVIYDVALNRFKAELTSIKLSSLASLRQTVEDYEGMHWACSIREKFARKID